MAKSDAARCEPLHCKAETEHKLSCNEIVVTADNPTVN
jgi:hypothetical protein